MTIKKLAEAAASLKEKLSKTSQLTTPVSVDVTGMRPGEEPTKDPYVEIDNLELLASDLINNSGEIVSSFLREEEKDPYEYDEEFANKTARKIMWLIARIESETSKFAKMAGAGRGFSKDQGLTYRKYMLSLLRELGETVPDTGHLYNVAGRFLMAVINFTPEDITVPKSTITA
jgi:hypothetical protein